MRQAFQTDGAPVFWGRRPPRLRGVDRVRTEEMKNDERSDEKGEEVRRREEEGKESKSV